MVVQVLDADDEVVHVVERLRLSKTTPLSKQVVECLAWTQLKQDVHVLLVLEMAVHLDYTLMAEIAMNRDLGLQLGVRTWLLHAFLVHNLYRVDLLCLAVRALVALCKAAFSQELPFEIPDWSAVSTSGARILNVLHLAPVFARLPIRSRHNGSATSARLKRTSSASLSQNGYGLDVLH